MLTTDNALVGQCGSTAAFCDRQEPYLDHESVCMTSADCSDGLCCYNPLQQPTTGRCAYNGAGTGDACGPNYVNDQRFSPLNQFNNPNANTDGSSSGNDSSSASSTTLLGSCVATTMFIVSLALAN